MQKNKVKWTRRTATNLGTCYEVVNDAGLTVLHAHRKSHCGFWYVYVGIGQDEADGTRFRTLWEAKGYAERELAGGRVSLVMDPRELVACRECQEEYEYQDLTDGECDECRREQCPECDGTGLSGEWDDNTGTMDCDYCGGDGVI